MSDDRGIRRGLGLRLGLLLVFVSKITFRFYFFSDFKNEKQNFFENNFCKNLEPTQFPFPTKSPSPRAKVSSMNMLHSEVVAT